VKIATFNINDVNKRLRNLIGWLRAEKPDVVALQELKAADCEFPKGAIEKVGYGTVWRGQKTWNGVAILARGCEPIVTRRELPGDSDDRQPQRRVKARSSCSPGKLASANRGSPPLYWNASRLNLTRVCAISARPSTQTAPSAVR
jgi:exonuclease III